MYQVTEGSIGECACFDNLGSPQKLQSEYTKTVHNSKMPIFLQENYVVASLLIKTTF